MPSRFPRIRTANAELSRLQDNVATVLDPLASFVTATIDYKRWNDFKVA